MSGRRPPASYWRSPARQPSTNRRPPGPASRPLHYREFTGVCPHSWMVRRRGRIRTCNIRFQRPSCCQLHHPPICRFARPPTRWTPSAGPDVTGTARHCDHPQTLAVPRQGGCRGDPSHGSGARRVPHARRVAYLACLRRDLNPRPSVPEADALSTGPRRLVSSAVPTAVHGPDTRRAWNRTTIGIATITRSPPHTLYGQGPHHRTGRFRISTYGRPCARPDHSALQLWTRAPGRIRTCDRTGRNRLL